jgi:hypothetical protein
MHPGGGACARNGSTRQGTVPRLTVVGDPLREPVEHRSSRATSGMLPVDKERSGGSAVARPEVPFAGVGRNDEAESWVGAR